MENKNWKIELYELLCEYDSEIPNPKIYDDCNTKQELAEHIMIAKAKKSINFLKMLLSYDF